ncbi:MAG: D-2-hydroxyacid dehydrogenase [Myxococcota bacterium]
MAGKVRSEPSRMKGSVLVSDVVERHFGELLDQTAPEMPRVVVAPDGHEGALDDVTVAYFSGDVFPDRTVDFLRTVIRAKGLRWFHSFSAGVDSPFFGGLLERGIRLSTSSGAMAAPIAHTVFLYILAFSRDLRGWFADQQKQVWAPRDVRDLQGRRLGVFGLGPIGLEIARLGTAFGMEVVGFRRNPRGDEPCETRTSGELADALGSLDYLVLAAPLSNETRGVIDAAALQAMKSDAVLVNIARGELVEEASLVKALTEGWIGGAALDVFEREPLPEDSPLWNLPNVILTPHSSGTNPGNFFRATEIFIDNLGRYIRDEPLRNEVTRPGERAS